MLCVVLLGRTRAPMRNVDNDVGNVKNVAVTCLRSQTVRRETGDNDVVYVASVSHSLRSEWKMQSFRTERVEHVDAAYNNGCAYKKARGKSIEPKVLFFFFLFFTPKVILKGNALKGANTWPSFGLDWAELLFLLGDFLERRLGKMSMGADEGDISEEIDWHVVDEIGHHLPSFGGQVPVPSSTGPF